MPLLRVSKPILLKIAPDLNETQLDEIIELVSVTKLEGVIASNTSISRENLKTDTTTLEAIGNGGCQRSTHQRKKYSSH